MPATPGLLDRLFEQTLVRSLASQSVDGFQVSNTT